MSEQITLIYQANPIIIVTGFIKNTVFVDTWYNDTWFGGDQWFSDLDLVKQGGTLIGNF